MFIFTKEMAKTLKEMKVKANLSQTEVVVRIGLKSKNAPNYISNLEAGKITNPTLRTILNYIRACGASWVEFFMELDVIDFKQRHAKMISQLPRPPEKRKVERDAMRYEIGIEFLSKEKLKRDIVFDRLKPRMALGFIKYRIRAEKIESEVHKAVFATMRFKAVSVKS